MTTPPVNRREFQKSVAFGAAAFSTTVAGSVAAGADKTDNNQRDPVKEPAATDPSGTDRPAEAVPLRPEEHLLEVIRSRYPAEQLTPEILSHILRDLRSDTGRSLRLSSFPLENADEPAAVFAAWRSDLPELLQRDRLQRDSGS